ncbi:MAG: hypothetical protein R3Y29_03835 [bacterium]
MNLNPLEISIIIFILMESMNVFILYFYPHLKIGNGIGVFDEWFKSQEDENTKLFVRYLVNWVAGVKLIFIVLLLVILLYGNELTKLFGVCAMILSILTYYWRLHPIIKKLDSLGQVTPKNYSKALFGMITGFISMFITAIIIYYINY